MSPGARHASTRRPTPNLRGRPILLLSFAVLMSSTGPVAVQASQATGPVFSFWRLWFGVPFVAVIAWLARQRRIRGLEPAAVQGWRSIRWSVWGGVAFAAHQLMFFTAIKMTSVIDVSLMGVLQPVTTAVGAAWIFGERPGLRFRMWTLLAIVGAVAVIGGGSAGPSGSPLGMTLAGLNVAFFTAFYLLAKRSQGSIDVASFLLGAILVSAIAVSGFVIITGEPVFAVDRNDLLFALFVAGGPGLIAHHLTAGAVRAVPANLPPLLRLALPFLAGLIAWAVLGEAIHLIHIVGGSLTMLGVAGALLSVDRGWSRSP